MKRLLSAIVLPALLINTGYVYAIDIQPGEWKVESTEMHVVDLVTKQVLIDQKNTGKTMPLCYTPKMSADSKNMKKGFTATEDGCTTKFVESSDTKLVSETTCDKPNLKTHAVVDTTRTSDTEFLITMKMDMDSKDRKMSTTSKSKQTFISPTCSEASKRTGTK